MNIGRRTFIGVLGGAVAAIATAEEWLQFAASTPDSLVATTRLVDDVTLFARKSGDYVITRHGSGVPILPLSIGSDCIIRWVAAPCGEILLRPGEPMLVVEGPSTCDWSLAWSTPDRRVEFHRVVLDRDGDEPIVFGDCRTPGGAARLLAGKERLAKRYLRINKLEGALRIESVMKPQRYVTSRRGGDTKTAALYI